MPKNGSNKCFFALFVRCFTNYIHNNYILNTMKKQLLIIALGLNLIGCGSAEMKKETSPINGNNNMIEVLYFHGKQRCATCVAIEENAKYVVDSIFTIDVENNKIAFKVLEIGENEVLADKYEVSWSSLILVDYNDGVETVENMTDFAFEYARTEPEIFINGLSEQITSMLNN